MSVISPRSFAHCTLTLDVDYSGAGLSGLAFGIGLQKYAPDIDFEIYEAATQLSEIGAGVGIQQRTWTIMQAMGIEEDLLKITEHGEDCCELFH